MRRPPFRKTAIGQGFWKAAVPATLVVVTVVLGTVGFRRLYETPAWDAFFLAVGLAVLEPIDPALSARIPLELHIARATGMTALFYAIALGYIALFGNLLSPLRIRLWSWGRGRSPPGHVVVCGLGWQGADIVSDLRSQRTRVVVIERDPDNPFLPAAREQGAVVLAGDATQLPILRAAHIRAADRVFIACDSDETNVRVLNQIAAMVGEGGTRWSKTVCNVEIHDVRTREFVHRLLSDEPGIYLNTFDPYEATARRLLELHPIDRFPEGEQVAEAHVVVMGLSPMGRAILFQCLLVGHFPAPRRLRVTVLCEDAERERASFLRRHPCFVPNAFGGNPEAENLRRQVLPECEFVELPTSGQELLDPESLPLEAIGPQRATTIFVCLDRGMRSAAYAASLLPSLSAAAHERRSDTRLAYYYEDSEEAQAALVERSLRDLACGLPVHAFGDFIDGCSVERVEGKPGDDLAREIARYYRELFGGEEWDRLSQADRDSNRHAADHVAVKLRSVGAVVVPQDRVGEPFDFSVAEVARLSETEHRRWSAEKLLTGWRPLRRTPENERLWMERKAQLKAQKLHFDLVPFERLPDAAKHKDEAQIRAIPSFLAALGLAAGRAVPAAGNEQEAGLAATAPRHREARRTG